MARSREPISAVIERFSATDLAGLENVAKAFAANLRPGDIVALHGDLGAGKTTFVAAIARALGNPSDVASPTFTFWHRYPGKPPLEHLDLYRIDAPANARELGLQEALDPASIAFVEWPDRLPGFLPPDAIVVRITGVGPEARGIEIERSG